METKRSDAARRLGSTLALLAAVALALVVAYTGRFASSRIEFLLDWDDTFSGSGTFTVVACEPEQVFGPDRWRCDGRLTTDDASDVRSELVVGKDARLTSRPYVGQQVVVFYAPAADVEKAGPPVVHARDAQLSELTRLYLVLLPLTMIMVGAAGSLVGMGFGWLRSRSSNPESRWRNSPLLLDLERRGAIWLVVGLATLAFYHLLVRYVLGSAGVA